MKLRTENKYIFMDIRLLSGIIISLLVGTGVTYTATQSQQSYLQGQLNVYKTEADKISDLQLLINSLTSEKSNLQKQTSTLQTQINSLTSDKTSFQQQLNDLNTQIATKNTQIASLNQQISQITASQSDYQLLAVSFSRTQDTSTLLRQWIGKANDTIKLMVYFITQDQLADSLIAAKNRGIDIDIVVDEYGLGGSESDYQRLLDAGIDIRSDNYAGTMHHKVMIVDDSVVATGSYNWSSTAEDSNYENLIILRSTDIAGQYISEFNRIWSQTVSSKSEPINAVQLTAGFTYSVNGLTVTFTDTSQDDVGVISWSWSYGDSQTSTSRNPSHAFSTGGTYIVTLTVRDADNHSSTASHSVTVTSGQPAANGPFWGSTNSNKYHYPSCYWALQIHSENLRVFSSSTEARNAGYIPCQVCHPP